MIKLKALVLAITALFLVINTSAGPVTISKAEKSAKNFLYIVSNKYDAGLSYNEIRLPEPFTYLIDGDPVFYAFELNPGFIIVSAEDAYVPVIGYSFEGDFDLENAPSHYKSFLQEYADQIITG